MIDHPSAFDQLLAHQGWSFSAEESSSARPLKPAAAPRGESPWQDQLAMHPKANGQPLRSDYSQQSHQPLLAKPQLTAAPSQVIQEGIRAQQASKGTFSATHELSKLTALEAQGHRHVYQTIGHPQQNEQLLLQQMGERPLQQLSQQFGLSVEQLTNRFFFAQAYPTDHRDAALLVQVATACYQPGAGESYAVAEGIAQLLSSREGSIEERLTQLAKSSGIDLETMRSQLLRQLTADDKQAFSPQVGQFFQELEASVRGAVRDSLLEDQWQASLPEAAYQLAKQLGVSQPRATDLLEASRKQLMASQAGEALPAAAVSLAAQLIVEQQAALNGPLTLCEGKSLATLLGQDSSPASQEVALAAKRLGIPLATLKEQLQTLYQDPSSSKDARLSDLLDDLTPHIAAAARDQLQESATQEAYPVVALAHTQRLLELSQELQLPIEQLFEQLLGWHSGQVAEVASFPPQLAALALQVEASARLMGKERVDGVPTKSDLRRQLAQRYEENFLTAADQLKLLPRSNELLFARYYPLHAKPATRQLLQQVEAKAAQLNSEQGLPTSFQGALPSPDRSEMAIHYDMAYEQLLNDKVSTGSLSEEAHQLLLGLHYLPQTKANLSNTKGGGASALEAVHRQLETQATEAMRQRYGSLPSWQPVPAESLYRLKVSFAQQREEPTAVGAAPVQESQVATLAADLLSPLAAASMERGGLLGPAQQKLAYQSIDYVDELLTQQEKTLALLPKADVHRVSYSEYLSITRGAIQDYRDLLLLLSVDNAAAAKKLSLAQVDKRQGELRLMQSSLEKRKEAMGEAREKGATLTKVMKAITWIMPALVFVASAILAIAKADSSYLLIVPDMLFSMGKTSTSQQAELLQMIGMVAGIIISAILLSLSILATIATGGLAAAPLSALVVGSVSLISLALNVVQMGLTLGNKQKAAEIVGYVTLALDILTIVVAAVSAAAKTITTAIRKACETITRLIQETAAQEAQEGIKAALASLLKKLGDMAADGFSAAYNYVIESIRNAVRRAIDAVQQGYREVRDSISSFVQGAIPPEVAPPRASSANPALEISEMSEARRLQEPTVAAPSAANGNPVTVEIDTVQPSPNKGTEGLTELREQATKNETKKLANNLNQKTIEENRLIEEGRATHDPASAHSEAVRAAYEKMRPYRIAFSYVETLGNLFDQLVQAYLTVRRAILDKINAYSRAQLMEVQTLMSYIDQTVADLRRQTDQQLKEVQSITKQLANIGSDTDRFWRQLSQIVSGLFAA